MIVDDFSHDIYRNSFSINVSPADLHEKILKSIANTAGPFTIAISNHANKDWNEDSLTQVFIGQNNFQLQKLSLSLMISTQYRDIYHKTKGIPDIFYSMVEEGRDHKPAFIMEAKRLPTPSTDREKEYVTGKTPAGNPNGGIERFKLGKHGAGYTRCGMIGFIEIRDYKDWFEKINFWITELFPTWKKSELLKLEGTHMYHNHYKSEAKRIADIVYLDHFWIKI